MKIRFLSVVAVLLIVCVGFGIYLGVYRNHIHTSNDDTLSANTTPIPTDTPSPTVTPIPADYESAPGIYSAYRTVDGVRKYGYINEEGNFTINSSFDTANDFHNGIATITMNNQYYAIGTTGNIIYDSDSPIGDFHNGAAVISRYSVDETLYGFIDSEGSEIIKPIYQMVSNFKEDGTAYVYKKSGKYFIIDKTGKILKSYLLDSQYNPYSIQDGYVIYYNSSNNQYGVVNLHGKVIFKANYCDISYLGDDLFALKKPDDNYGGSVAEIPAALYNAKGDQLTDYSLYDISNFHNGYASVTDSKDTYFICKDGKEATGLPKYEGRGTVTLLGDVIKAEIDHNLTYSKMDLTVIWQNKTSQPLSDDIVAKQIKFKPNRNVLVYYPKLEGLKDTSIQKKINTKLKSLFTANRAELKEEDLYGVDDSFQASLIKNLLIIERTGYDYPFGAAHGSPIMDYFYIDITTGTSYQLKDLFIEGSDYISAINKMISNELAATLEEDSLFFPGSFTTIAENQSFILSKDSLTIYFGYGEIAAYAAGFPQFEYPIEDLYDYIDLKGAFWKSYH